MPQAKKSGSSNLPLMIVAFLAIAGFFYWLNMAAEPTEFTIAEETPETAYGPAVSVSLGEFARDPSARVGQRVQIANVQVGELMGAHAFWLQFPPDEDEEARAPYFVHLDREWIDRESQILPGDVVSISGRVFPMSDSVVSAWERSGVFTAEGERPVIMELETFLEADQLEVHAHAATEPETDGNADEGDGG